ncbi:transmembrane protein 106A isoform X2 [Apodemus sylvaticus]|uniref:transmembrane protein 106A isoform X2 n=1 Tax=Apodemus sylvaticus TaxID=10129 RepID=UPI002241E6E9|nr:transmembrane protein 106A isoform X2 [Apodemus sylvaticus]
MGKALSKLTSQKDEDKPILPDNPAIASKVTNYFSTDSSKPAHSYVPYEKAACTSFVTCPTCQGNGEIPQGLNSSAVAFDKTHVQLNMTNVLTVFNSNFYPVTVTQLTAEVLHQASVVGQVTSSLHLRISPLASEQMSYEVASRILDENTYKICTWPKIRVHHVLLNIQGSLTCSYLSHPQQLPFESFEYVDCRENISVPHLELSHPA